MAIAVVTNVNVSVRKNVDANRLGVVVDVENQPLGRTAVRRQRRHMTRSPGDVHGRLDQSRHRAHTIIDHVGWRAIYAAVIRPVAHEGDWIL